MLSYAFQILKQSNYENVAAEEFDKVQDLFAAILAKGVAKQLKQGLYFVLSHCIKDSVLIDANWSVKIQECARRTRQKVA